MVTGKEVVMGLSETFLGNDVHCDIRLITPHAARLILDSHDNYRKLDKNRAGAYSDIMSSCEHEWGLSVLLFDDDGNLCDGQTRLTAVFESNTKQPFLCVHGFPKEHVKYLDSNKVRSAGIIAAKELGLKNGNNLMAIAKKIYNPFSTRHQSPSVQMETYKSCGALIDLAFDATRGGPLSKSLHAICLVRAMASTGDGDKALNLLNCVKAANDYDFSFKGGTSMKIYIKKLIASLNKKDKGSVPDSVRSGCAVIKQVGGSDSRGYYLTFARALGWIIAGLETKKLYAHKHDPFNVGGLEISAFNKIEGKYLLAMADNNAAQ